MSPAEQAAARAATPVVRYMGNKAAIASCLVEAMARAAPEGLAVDPMAGSHAVTSALRASRPLVASDAQAYSAVIGRAFIANDSVSVVDVSTRDALAAAARTRRRGRMRPWLARTYGDTYLGEDQCRDLAALRAAVDDVLPDERDPARWLAIAAILHAACRAQASPGHFAQFLPPDHPRVSALRRIDVLGVACEALRSWRVEPGRPATIHALPWRRLVDEQAGTLGEAACWYLDPPYTTDQYSRFYHLLETLALGDEPEVAHGARYRTDRFRSAFCSRRGASVELAALAAAVRGASPRAAIVLSYADRGVLSRTQLLDALAASSWRLSRFEEVPRAWSTQGKGLLRGVTEWIVTFSPPAPRSPRPRGPRPARAAPSARPARPRRPPPGP